MKKYYMSIGYPIGLAKNIEDNENYYNVELNGTIIRLSNISYQIWNKCFFDIKEKEFIIKEFKLQEEIIMSSLETLIKNNLLIEINENLDEIYNVSKKITPLRNGFGIGLKDENQAIILNQKQNFLISLVEYNIWSESNNRKTIEEIVSKFQKEEFLEYKTAKHYVINAILKLKTIDLIRLNLKEG